MNKINQETQIPKNALLVTIDAIGLYTNIPQEYGTQCLQEALDDSDKSQFIVKLVKLLLKHNLFEFNSTTWKQVIGTAMGVHPAPSYANIYVARRIDKIIKELAINKKNGESCLLLFKQFLDDIIQLFIGTTKELHIFFDKINRIHPTLKVTMQHTSSESEKEEDRCSCEFRKSIPFLDTSLSLKNGKIEIDLYRKETDKKTIFIDK